MDMRPELIAPCGINCRVCYVHMRDKHPCPGCAGANEHKPRHCIDCAIKHCAVRPAGSPRCDACPKLCRRLKDMDRRYRNRYGVSLLGNLHAIREEGLDAFVEHERARWSCPSCSALLCQHETACRHCGTTYQNE